eukprot:1032861-Amphidinium_carterae.1
MLWQVAHRDIKFENCLITDGDLSLGRKLAKVISAPKKLHGLEQWSQGSKCVCTQFGCPKLPCVNS